MSNTTDANLTPSIDMIEQHEAGLFTPAMITDMPSGSNITYIFVKLLTDGVENGLEYKKGDGAFLWKDGFPCDSLSRGQTIHVSDIRMSRSYRNPGDKKFCCNFAPAECQPEPLNGLMDLANAAQEQIMQPEPQTMTPAIRKVVDGAIVERKAQMQGLNKRLQVSRTFKGKNAHYLEMLAKSAGTPSEALEACLDYCYDQNFGF